MSPICLQKRELKFREWEREREGTVGSFANRGTRFAEKPRYAAGLFVQICPRDSEGGH